MKTLGASIMFYNPESQDYCWREAIESIKALADEVVILECGSTDGSVDLVKSYADSKTKVICLPNEEWSCRKGRYKLSELTNIAKSMLSSEWHFNIQADEVLDQNSFDAIREAIEQPEAEAFFCNRINMWADSKHYLDVADARKPVGTEIIRLAKTEYDSIDDAQSIHAPASWDYLNKINIFHMGFIRSKFVHNEKIRHMLVDVFGHGETDQKVAAMGNEFDCWVHFSKEDVTPLEIPLPIYVQKWAEERDKINDFKI